MPEFTLDDGRKAEKVETTPDARTKVTEVYVEPKVGKKLSQRVIERFCVCERETQTINEDTGEVVDSVVENLCSSGRAVVSDKPVDRLPMKKAVEDRIAKGSGGNFWLFAVIIAVQVAALAYVLLFM